MRPCKEELQVPLFCSSQGRTIYSKYCFKSTSLDLYSMVIFLIIWVKIPYAILYSLSHHCQSLSTPVSRFLINLTSSQSLMQQPQSLHHHLPEAFHKKPDFLTWFFESSGTITTYHSAFHSEYSTIQYIWKFLSCTTLSLTSRLLIMFFPSCWNNLFFFFARKD